MTANVRSVGFTRFVAILTFLVAMCALITALPATAHATTYYVSVAGTDTASGLLGHPVASVQKALHLATSSGDVVSVGPGTFSGDVTMTVSGVSLRGAGASMTTLRGDGQNSVIDAENISSGASISGFTITGGSAVDGGGIYCFQSSIIVTSNTITGNTASNEGGGIDADASGLTISGNTIANNSGYDGGGITCGFCSPTITSNSITGNTAADDGSGIYCTHSAPSISGNSITDNNGGVGAGISCFDASSPNIANNTIARNISNGNGGGIYCNTSSPAITGNLVIGNSAPGDDGGGIFCAYSSSTIDGNTIDNNVAGNDGGGIASVSSTPTITRDTILGNDALYGGGGIYCANPSWPTIVNDVVASNRSTYGGGIYFGAAEPALVNETIADNSAPHGGSVYCLSGVQPLVNCIVWGNSTPMSGCSTTYSELASDPLFIAPESGDYHLSADSPCIDDASATAAPAADRDGIPRPWGAGFDIGAYEYYVPTYHTSTSLSAPKSVKVRKSLTLSGAISPSSASPYAAPGRVTVTMTRKVGRRWRSAGSAKISVVGGLFTYSFKPRYTGSWHFVANYSGGAIGPTTYLPSQSGVRGVTVK
ncbi:MAG: choice-of-anchor Q domain-containing protein [Coriobacteriia bacterium]|nr:choice-of-anchor Q domain-containing protein [Coriobacteriia bacterium]